MLTKSVSDDVARDSNCMCMIDVDQSLLDSLLARRVILAFSGGRELQQKPITYDLRAHANKRFEDELQWIMFVYGDAFRPRDKDEGTECREMLAPCICLGCG